LFPNVRAENADFGNAALVQAIWQAAELGTCRFDRANLQQAYFEKATVSGCTFRDADLTYADFSHAKLNRCVFDGATMHRAVWHAVLENDVSLPQRKQVIATDPVRRKAELWGGANERR
jgi:uncharacterized protein YjbI with pentapeptide repeats